MNTTPDKSIHAHDIMGILAENPMTETQLQGFLLEKAGADLKFHACSAQDMNFDEIIIFLKERSKIEDIDGVLHFTGTACNH